MILNAGISAYTRFEDVRDTSAFHDVMQVNYFGCLYMTRYAFPVLKKSNGQIVVMSSFSGEVGLMNRSAYCSSKFALNGFFESLRIEFTQANVPIHITIICPTSLNTNIRSKILGFSFGAHILFRERDP